MRNILALSAAFGLILGAGSAAIAAPVLHGPPAAVQAILETEHAFARRVGDAGLALGFRDYMDVTDGLSFGGAEPVRGAEAIYKQIASDQPDKDRLSWEPTEIYVAASADMAVSWGHYTYTAKSTGQVVRKGRYVTVWRKDAKGTWKGLIDIGDPDA